MAATMASAGNAAASAARRALPAYVLITPARNEAAFIEKTLDSMVAQTVRPLKWVIVDDGSTDDTAAIVSRYFPDNPWIELLSRPRRAERTFAGKAHSLAAGYERVRDLPFEVIGNLDADISFEPDHFEFLLGHFAADPKLGVAGTIFRQDGGYSSDRDSFEGSRYVAGQCQLFRRACWEQIGGYVPNPAGGLDWIAVTTARMRGWETRSYRERAFFHHRRLGTAERGPVAAMFSYGQKDYYLGGHPLWQAFRVAYRAFRPPYVVGGLALGLGYGWAALRRLPRPVSRELMRFHRREQLAKLRAICAALARGRKPDAFALGER